MERRRGGAAALLQAPAPRPVAAGCRSAIESDASAEAASANALDSGLTEIALALAMAFFSIMVLAMVSLAVPTPPDDTSASAASDAGLVVAATAATTAAEPAVPAGERRLVVLHAGGFLDADLSPRDPATIEGPATLAVAPGLSLEQAIAARQRLTATTDVIVATLDQRWLARLASLAPAEEQE